MNNNCLFLWILGSPRSGTTFITDFIGKFTDKSYNEPWQTHPLNEAHSWKFPPAKNIVFKYCENWKNIEIILSRFKNNHFIHVWRNPDNVINSMAFPKYDSYPPRNLYGNFKEDQIRVKLCMERWYSNIIHSMSLYKLMPNNYHEIQYEKPKKGLLSLSNKLNLNLNLETLKYKSKNVKSNLDWDLHPQAKKLRNLIMKYNDETSLVEFIKQNKPHLLTRVLF